MKGIYCTINFRDILNSLEKLCVHDCKLKITILTWDDGDYFEQLCEEDGGIIPEHVNFFKNKPLNKKVENYYDLQKIFNLAKKIPYLSSKNGNYKLFYDIHLTINRHYLCYNVHMNKCFYRYRNIFQHFLGILIFPEWHNYNNEYEKKKIIP